MTCPTPTKMAFNTRAAAGKARGRGRSCKGKRMTPYHCTCGLWHLRTAEKGAAS